MTFAATITVPQQLPDHAQALCEQLLQDGFAEAELRVPPLTSPLFTTILHDAQSFVDEVGLETSAWPIRGERWLNRLSTMLTGQMFWELQKNQRRAIAHAAVSIIQGRG